MTASTATVIFDFDGTLVDSFALALQISNRLAPLFGFNTVSEEEVPSYRDSTMREILRRLAIPLHLLPLALARGRSEMLKEMSHVSLFEGIPSMLENLKTAGCRMGIVTSNALGNVEECLRRNGVSGYFEFVHSASNLLGKHRVLGRVLKKQGLLGGRVLYVGDEIRDVEASRKCHIPVVAVSWGFQSRRQLVLVSPDFVADTPLELEGYILGRLCSE